MNTTRVVSALLLATLFGRELCAGPTVEYDIVYVRQPRYGSDQNTHWAEVSDPARLEPGAELMLLHPDGSEEVLVGGGSSSVADPSVSFDGKWIYYSYYYDLSPEALNKQRRSLPKLGADIFRLHVDTREIEQLTFGEFTPNTGVGQWDESNPVDPPGGFNYLGYGVVNTGPTPVPGGKVAFTSNRNAFLPNKSYTYPNMQLYVMDEDGGNVTPIAPMNLGSALHPTILQDGRIMFSSFEAQGIRDNRLWGLWAIYPDGRDWSPLVSAFKRPSAFHFATQLADEDIVVVDYYNQNNSGFGALYRFPVRPPPGSPAFHGADPDDNPEIAITKEIGKLASFQMAFTPVGMHSISPFTHGEDQAAPIGPGGARVGKLTHPSAAPNDDLLVVWTPGPANDLDRPTPKPYYDGGIYLLPKGAPVSDPGGLVPLKNHPKYNEAWPRALVPYKSIHGVVQPDERPWLPNDGTLHPELPKGTPYGLVGTSSVYNRESFPGVGEPAYDGLDPFNSSHNAVSSNWFWQGADAGLYGDDEIWAIRVLVTEPTTSLGYGPNYTGVFGRHYANHAAERLRILGEVPLRKFGPGGTPILDPEGNPDTSFVVKIPADTPYTFQTIDRNGLVLNMAQTWHQVRPGERQVNCGGCHAHSQPAVDFDATAAAQSNYSIYDLSKVTPMVTHDENGDPDLHVETGPVQDVEFYRDIRPLLQSRCVSCHTKTDPDPPGALVFDDLALYDGLPGDYKRLAADPDAKWGLKAVIKSGTWRDANASRYVRKFQSRRSLLIWKLFGARLDGWANEDHPTETVPGNPNTLPVGADSNLADLDFTGTIMPPPTSGVSPLTIDEKMMFARWIDLGAPINTGEQTGNGHLGWFVDDLRPAVTVSSPRPGYQSEPITSLRFGFADAHSGIDPTTLSVRADFPVNGVAAGDELAGYAASIHDGVFEIALTTPIGPLDEGHLKVEVADHQGNVTRVDQRFTTIPPIPPLGLFAATYLPVAAVGHGYDTDLDASGGAPPYGLVVTAGKLPPGLHLEPSGHLLGTPTKKGNFDFHVRVQDSVGGAATTQFVLRVFQALGISTSKLPGGKHGKEYGAAIKVKGGANVKEFEVTEGELPTGLELDPDTGKLSGTLLAPGEFQFEVHVLDSTGATDTASLSIKVKDSLKLKTKKLPPGKTGKSYSAKLKAAGGVKPYTWWLDTPNLPAGLSLDAATGVIGGIPTAGGTTDVTIRVVDSTGEERSRIIKIKT